MLDEVLLLGNWYGAERMQTIDGPTTLISRRRVISALAAAGAAFALGLADSTTLHSS